MRNKSSSLLTFGYSSGLTLLLTWLVIGGLDTASAAEILTLFTTPAERQIINSNRYNRDEIEVKAVDTAIQAPVQKKPMEEVIHSYRVNGITISKGGSHSVWINDSVYVDGDELSDSSKIKILHDGDIKVRITAPDGKQYFAKSGETVEAAYLVPVQE